MPIQLLYVHNYDNIVLVQGMHNIKTHDYNFMNYTQEKKILTEIQIIYTTGYDNIHSLYIYDYVN